MTSPFNTDFRPDIGVPIHLTEGLSMVVAPNASPMTFTGTNSYILGDQHLAIIDPGPADPAHLAALKKATAGRRISHIIVTHSHIDHSPMARYFDAPVYAFGNSDSGRSPMMQTLSTAGGLAGGEGIDHNFQPDIIVNDGDIIQGTGWQLEAVHTPGHMSNHLCFSWMENLFSGDHVMGWSTTLVSPPDGDLTQFMASLRKLQNRPEHRYYPGHGAPLENPEQMLEHQLKHRTMREEQIISALSDGLITVEAITARIYADLPAHLHPMAARNVFSHVIDLLGRGIVSAKQSPTFSAGYHLT